MGTEPTIADVMAAYAQDAVDHAKVSYGIDLDYTPDSVKQVEMVLGRLHDAMPRGFLARLFGRAPSESAVATMAKMYGGYIGEVIGLCGRPHRRIYVTLAIMWTR